MKLEDRTGSIVGNGRTILKLLAVAPEPKTLGLPKAKVRDELDLPEPRFDDALDFLLHKKFVKLEPVTGIVLLTDRGSTTVGNGDVAVWGLDGWKPPGTN